MRKKGEESEMLFNLPGGKNCPWGEGEGEE